MGKTKAEIELEIKMAESELEKELFTYDEKLIEDLEKYKNDRGLSYKKLSSLIGIGESTLAEWRTKKYNGSIKTVEAKVENFLGRKKQMTKRINFIAETHNKKVIFENLRTVQEFVASSNHEGIVESAKIGIVVGRAGLGKTKAIEEYIKQQKNCTMITAENGDTERSIMSKLARQFNLNAYGTLYSLRELVKGYIKSKELLIIIDEAEHLKPKTIDVVRSAIDGTGTGLILVGTGRLRDKLMSQKGEYEYLYSRIVAVSEVRDLSIEDVFLIVSKYIEQEQESYTTNEINILTKVFHKFSNGSARNLSNLIAMSMKIAKSESNLKLSNGKVSPSFIERAKERIWI